MTEKILVSAKELQQLQAEGNSMVVDCRFNLIDAQAGYQSYLGGHIPGAVYANLDKDLSSPVTPVSGRHPLPDSQRFAEFLSRCGWQSGMSLVAYDDMGGAFAARLWWLMKYFGLSGAALLDGGLKAWMDEGYDTASGSADLSVASTAIVEMQPQPEMLMTADEVEKQLASQELLLVDARAGERFRGDIEPIDAVAGHVPGAKNFPFSENMTPAGLFKQSQEIRQQWLQMQGDVHTDKLVHMCGSGVTACFNQFAAELAGIHGSKLYAGSWSEWIRDPERGVEAG